MYYLKDIFRLYARDLIFWMRSATKSQSKNIVKRNLLLCNSYPKSGTHLIYQILLQLPGYQPRNNIVSYQALSGFVNTLNHIKWKVGCMPNSSIVRSHLPNTPKITEFIEGNFHKKVFIYRDLRDVAVSHANWILKEPRYFMYKLYKEQIIEWDKCLMASIVGMPPASPEFNTLAYPDIKTDFSRWKSWIDDEDTFSIKFEDLVGERGGGSEVKRMEVIANLLDYLEIDMPIEDMKAKFSSIAMDPSQSHTFKKGTGGKIGTWRKYFNEEHKTTFKKTVGSLLIDLGYEKDMNW